MKKVYLKRDGAAAALRKAGVPREDYDKFIVKVEGGFEVELPDLAIAPTAKDLVAGSKTKDGGPAPKKITKPKGKPVKKAKAKSDKPARISIGSVVRDLVKAGKDNDAIWKAIKAQFKLDDTKKWYPAWYRADVARRKKAGK